MSDCIIPLTKGQFTVVDDIDSDLAELKWCASKGPTNQTYYAVRRVPGGTGATYSLHRTILIRILGRPLASNELADHIDRDGMNNRRSNLRLATRAQNQQNRTVRRDSTSGVKGVYWDKRRQKWHAEIRINGKHIHLGRFDDPELAIAAYRTAAQELHGEFARLE